MRMARIAGHLKSLITDPNIVITAPYQPVIEIASFHRVLLTTNVAMPAVMYLPRRIDEIKCHKLFPSVESLLSATRRAKEEDRAAARGA